ncbi:MAG: Sec-independent protein translocase subunit TatA [Pseudoclavibacter sp.]|nr:Sec-independent protein translocase subunit TatA [Pseudoclavibacter sp.]
MLQNLSGWHFLILLVIILLLFGAPRLPALARSLGQSMRIFKGEVRAGQEEDARAHSAAEPTAGEAADGPSRD